MHDNFRRDRFQARKELSMDRNETLANKAEKVRLALKEWAANEGILGPGEQIVFTLAIRPVPTVMQEASNDFHSMHPVEFFTKTRLIELGINPRAAQRACNSLLWMAGYYHDGREHRSGQHKHGHGDDHPPIKSMSEFAARYFIGQRIRNLHNVGKENRIKLVEAFRLAGFKID